MMHSRSHILSDTELTTGRRKPSEIVAEYEYKRDSLAAAFADFTRAGTDLKSAATVGGTWGNVSLCTGRVYVQELTDALLKSAWRHVYQLYGLDEIATAQDKRRIAQMFEKPPAFTVENIREQFGAYVMDPWGSILRGLAEVFAGLDPAFKSHERMKIGVKGLPKRVILTHGRRDQTRDILNAIAAYQRKPLLTHLELSVLEKDGDALRDGSQRPDPFQSQWERDRNPNFVTVIGRGVWLRYFQNGHAHMFFAPDTLRDVNKALAEFYGDVLPDCYEPDEERPAQRASTEVARDLQYYATPGAVIDRLMRGFGDLRGLMALEPSCGCGRIMDALAAKGASVYGIEVDPGRAAIARAKRHDVWCGNFLEVTSATLVPVYDLVVMNPPFYRKHYAKHVRHALRFLKPGGTLKAILPATARYDHGLLNDLSPSWDDLPVGAFAESGTNVCTTIATIRAAQVSA